MSTVLVPQTIYMSSIIIAQVVINTNKFSHKPSTWSTVQCSAVQCSAVQYSTVHYSTVQYSKVQ